MRKSHVFICISRLDSIIVRIFIQILMRLAKYQSIVDVCLWQERSNHLFFFNNLNQKKKKKKKNEKQTILDLTL